MHRLSRRQFLRAGLALAGPGMRAGCRLSPPWAGSASDGSNPRLIGVLGDSPSPRWDGFREGLRELGWAEGRNLTVEYRWTGGDNERYRAFTEELVRLRVELVVAGALPASIAAKQATSTVPIVAILATGEALENGLVDNIARPGGNITGTAGISGEQLESKQLELLKEATPGASRVAVLAHVGVPTNESRIEALRGAAPKLGMELQIFPVEHPAGPGLESAFSAMDAAGARALKILPSTTWDAAWGRVADLATRQRLPAISEYPEFPRAGGLLGYGVNRPDIYRSAASYVDRILKGARPGDLPMERPTTFDFVVNLQTAQALGLAIPASVLAQATEIIQ